MGYYAARDSGFRLFESTMSPAWRRPQLAALGQLISHWYLAETEPPLVSLPTGVGKTAVAMAAPHVLGSERVLVVVPSTDLRSQTAARFRDQSTLRQIGALRDEGQRNPRVLEVAKRVEDWNLLRDFDVIVALPNCISPHHYPETALPPRDLFSLLIIDEAHHAPAPTWNVILDHFSGAQALLLTATPRRRDRKRVPGKLVLYYPLRKALDERLFQPVDAVVLRVPGASKSAHDQSIATEVAAVLSRSEHATSKVLVRASTIERAGALATHYRRLGLEIDVLHSRMGRRTRQEVIDRLRSGSLRGVAIVGMLIEGFDLPSLRVAAYHDKHKSLETTAQLIGRLARIDAAYPQRSVVVTVDDIDTYPHLQGAVRMLYEEDHDWARVLPGIIDAEIQEDQENVAYARSYSSLSTSVDPAALHPLRRAVVFEVRDGYEPPFLGGQLPEPLSSGARLEGQTILYSAVGPKGDSIILVTGVVDRPRWNRSDALDSARYELHGLAFSRSRHTAQPHLLFVNTVSEAFKTALLEAIGAKDALRPADTGRLQRAFDSLERISVSSVGVRNTHAARGVPSYRMFAGSGIESGLRHSDTGHASLGHAMVQVSGDDGAFTAGVSTGKAKWWETRYTPLKIYDSFIADLAERYWYPPVPPIGPLLPQISRGQVLTSWPSGLPVAAEIDPALVGREWEIPGVGSLDRLELHVGRNPVLAAPGPSEAWLSAAGLRLWAAYPMETGLRVIWEGALTLAGQVVPANGNDVEVRRGFAPAHSFGALLTERPPTIYFLDGSSVIGHTVHPPLQVPTPPLDRILEGIDWPSVDIRSETAVTAGRRGVGVSVHERLEAYLGSRPPKGKHRWIICNDGPGEIADYLCLEVSSSSVFLGLWHAKYAHGDAPAVRVGDFEEVISQAIKSRRWMTDRRLWHELAARLRGDASPPARVVHGHRRKLEILLGEHAHGQRLSLARRSPQIQGEVGIAQPGLSRGAILAALAATAPSPAALQVQQLLAVWQDSLNPVAGTAQVLCSA